MEINKIYNENCLITLARMPDCFVDLTITSPPYDNLRDYKGYSFDFESIARELYRVTKESGVVVWVVGDATIKGSETGTSFRQALWAKECGFNLHDTMIWQKVAIPYDPKCERYWQAFDYMFVWSKGKPKCNYIKVPCKLAGKKKTNDYGQRRPDGTLRTDRHDDGRVIKDTKVKGNVWFQPNTKQKGDHPASFPEQLAHDHIISWSNPGDVVLDCFAGSGTTGIMAYETGRNCILIEKDETYCDIIKERFNKRFNKEIHICL